ncbi:MULTISPECIES: amidohydrolase [Roseivirga]|uniref:N-acyl-L-amino acid amidohydrolase n=1 Tax=Roseivirga spongicola TaxID=333140 RepID=A0A150XGE2_9BACT|nr:MULTISPECIES: amidohydrolase [Roseivirga]KYG77768.1 N-acyl-L-amino acid amidohydrolase [Roseivirga spongicola]MBO6661423.1 amidohydrolase [Roseivirga sp.]MBO6760350.1 amidohydrolase [Roseivirga sp.]MBO6908593.1 amidohydrolase [Roseivirga sp.]WPZ11495.1 amidohydrolase [Roseivirga spongicola]
MKKTLSLFCLSFLFFGLTSISPSNDSKPKLSDEVLELAKEVEPKVIEWRHWIHENAELSNREFKTAAYIAAHLKSLGIEVQEGVAKTGVVGILKGGKPGPTIGLRADMDGLPVKERVDLPWASKQMGEYNGEPVPVMHACGHDTHVAILMGVAEVLSRVKKDIQGTVKFVFQPAEEGAPAGEEGGAALMVKEGVTKGMDVIFGLHINSQTEVGKVMYRPNGIMAAVNSFEIKIKGKQTHGSTPWTGIDPVVTAAQIINNAQTIVSRSLPLTTAAAVLTFGKIEGGVRSNIIPEEVNMVGTIRTLDADMRETLFERFRTIVQNTAESNGAEATLSIDQGYPVTYNDPQLTAMMGSTFVEVIGAENVNSNMNAITGAEDFSFFQQEIPGLFFFLGGMPKGQDPAKAAPHHTPDFYVDDAGMLDGIKLMSRLVVDYAEKVN